MQAGLVTGTNLVSDSIGVETIAVRPNLALALGASAEMRLDQYHVGVSLAYSRSDLVSHAPSGDATITRLALWYPSLYLRQVMRPWLSGEVHLGALIYDPERSQGTLFRDGAPVEPAIGLGVRVEGRLGSRLAAGVGIQYNVHRFSTSTLQAQGFSGETFVHRVATFISIRRVARDDPASR